MFKVYNKDTRMMTIADFDQVTAGWVVFPKKTITFL